MKEFIGAVEAAKAEHVTEHVATQMGTQVGMVMAAALVGKDFHSYASSAVSIVSQSKFYDEFCDAVWAVVEDTLKEGMDGLSARAAASRNLYLGATSLRAKLDDLTLKEEAVQDFDTVQTLLDTSELMQRAADFLRYPIEDDLRHVCESAKKVQMVKDAQQAQKDAMMDHLRDNTDCDDPNCPIHNTH